MSSWSSTPPASAATPRSSKRSKRCTRNMRIAASPSSAFRREISRRRNTTTRRQIKEFCTLTYGVKFPMFEKVHVVGADATPLYKDLAAVSNDPPKWNFHKYLIGRDGRLIASWGSKTTPDDAGDRRGHREGARRPQAEGRLNHRPSGRFAHRPRAPRQWPAARREPARPRITRQEFHRMKGFVRGIAALLALVALSAHAQDKTQAAHRARQGELHGRHGHRRIQSPPSAPTSTSPRSNARCATRWPASRRSSTKPPRSKTGELLMARIGARNQPEREAARGLEGRRRPAGRHRTRAAAWRRSRTRSTCPSSCRRSAPRSPAASCC